MRPYGLPIGWVWIETVERRGRRHPKRRHLDVKGEVPSITVAGAERVTAPAGAFDAYRGKSQPQREASAILMEVAEVAFKPLPFAAPNVFCSKFCSQ